MSVKSVRRTLALWVSAAEPEIVFVAATNHAMPLSQFQASVLTGGILKDPGDAIAQRMKRRARFISLPSRRVNLAMLNGEADGVCYVRPRWLEGSFYWSRPLIPAAAVLVSRTGWCLARCRNPSFDGGAVGRHSRGKQRR